MTPDQAVNLALEHFRAGQPQHAEAILRQVLMQYPTHAGTLRLLGLLAHQTGHHAAAIQLLSTAIAADPKDSDSAINLGAALAAIGRLDEAIAAYNGALALRPDSIEAFSNLGDALYRKGNWDGVISACQRALSLRPDIPEAACNLGAALLNKRQYADAVAWLRRAVELRPNYFQALNNLGNALAAQRDWPAAISAYRQAIAFAPNYAQTHVNLADALARLGDLDQAVTHYHNALNLQPNLTEAHHQLANALYLRGETDAALQAYRRASNLQPADASLAGDRLMVMQFHPHREAEILGRELRIWDEQYARPLKGQFVRARAPGTAPRQNGRLKIGYVSADFREHVVGWNLQPILSNHDRTRFEIACYSSVVRPDAMTDRLKGHADIWRDILDLTDQQAADLIASDGIDILIDLSLHSAGNRLLIFARKPAPVQACYLGYAGTTGMSAMDFRLSDPVLDPPDIAANYAEKTVRLPHCYWCYSPGGPAPDPVPAPSQTNGYVTFGCLANFAKSAAAIDLWAQILAAVPDSKLLLNCPPGTARQRVLQRVAARNIAPARLEFVGNQSFDQYMRTYQRIDIALDPFPYGGAITTCDALWMGVSVITLRGRAPISRAAASILTNIGLPELSAATEEEYVLLAKATDRILPFREGLRDRLAKSPLMQYAQFTRDLEAAYLEMAQMQNAV
ncbi:MAG: tetratricopeptide repeat protein [Tepidisphaeraceae bacterium]